MWNGLAAPIVFFAGVVIVAAPLILRLGWLLATAGILRSAALGASAGVLWVIAKPSAAQ
jgi:hypothetical protein